MFAVVCPAGRQYDPLTEACESCALGQYKSESDSVCVDCQAGRTTSQVGSTSSLDCNTRKTHPALCQVVSSLYNRHDMNVLLLILLKEYAVNGWIHKMLTNSPTCTLVVFRSSL